MGHISTYRFEEWLKSYLQTNVPISYDAHVYVRTDVEDTDLDDITDSQKPFIIVAYESQEEKPLTEESVRNFATVTIEVRSKYPLLTSQIIEDITVLFRRPNDIQYLDNNYNLLQTSRSNSITFIVDSIVDTTMTNESGMYSQSVAIGATLIFVTTTL